MRFMKSGHSIAGLIIVLIGVLMLFLPSTGNATVDTFWVTTEEDDCQQHSVSGWDSTASSYFIAQVSVNTWTVGFRFLSVTIPQGTTIDSARLELSTVATCPEPTGCESICWGEDTDNSAVFYSGDTPVDRDKTTACDTLTVISEDTPNGENFRSFDVTPVLQEILDRGGFAEEAVSFLTEDNSAAAKGTIRLLAYTWDSGFTEPKLIVGWTAAAAAGQVIIIGDASDFHRPPRAYLDWRE